MSEQAAPPPLLFEVVENHIAVLRLNRPQVRNAVNIDLAQAMAEAVGRVERDPALRVVVLMSSNPGMFCAGADLSVVAAGRVTELRPGDNGFAGLVDALRDKPWIAAVDGPALGGGFEICLACDMIVASPESRFGLPEVKRGLIAAAGGVHRAVRVLPRNLALEMVATGEPMDAATAYAHGMINRIAPAEEVFATALGLARLIVANAPVSVAESLRLARMAGDRSDTEMRRLSREAMTRVMATADAQEGPRAFKERRPPNWQGR